MNDPKRIIIVVLSAIFIALCFLGLKGKMDSDGYKKQVSYTTALQATDARHFNYAIDTQQGRVLSTGTFTIDPKNAVKFDEMNQSYGYAKRTQEHYTMHTRENCTSDSDGHEHCTTETYYTWDETGEEEKESPTVLYFGRSYPAGLFNIGQFIGGTNCESFMATGSGSGFFETKHGCLDGDNYIDDDNRYTYDTMPLSFSGTFLATTEGGLHGFNENTISLQQKSIPQVLHDVGRYQIVSFWVMTTILIIIIIATCFVAYGWVMEDGVWSLDE